MARNREARMDSGSSFHRAVQWKAKLHPSCFMQALGMLSEKVATIEKAIYWILGAWRNPGADDGSGADLAWLVKLHSLPRGLKL